MFKRYGQFHCLSEFEPRLSLDQWQMVFEIPWAKIVNINVYAKLHHNIPLGSRDGAISTFSEFGARQSLD